MDAIVEARAAVTQLLSTYCRGCDRLDRSLLDQVFAADAAVDMGGVFQGSGPEFVDVAMAFMASWTTTRHELSTIYVSVAADGSAGYDAYVRAWHRIDSAEGTSEVVALARYIGRAARGAQGWRIVQHGEVLDWGEQRVVDPAWFEGGADAALPKGRRDRNDGSYAMFAPV